MIWLLFDYLKQTTNRHSYTDYEDLASVKLHGKRLGKFWESWKFVLRNITKAPADDVLEHLVWQQIKDCDLIYFIDNSAALSALVKGRSGNPDMDWLARWVHLQTYHLNVRLWLEYVETDANWADGASRLGAPCDWAALHGFELKQAAWPRLHS